MRELYQKGMVIIKADRRFQKTQTAIMAAFVALLQEKRYNRITIQEIIDRANIGRTTFYAHYATKDDLLNSCVDTILESLHSQPEGKTEGDNPALNIPVRQIFEHVQQNQSIVRGIFMSDSGDLLLERLTRDWGQRIQSSFQGTGAYSSKLNLPPDILSCHLINTMLSLIRYWLNNKMIYSPDQMTDFYYHLTAGILPVTHVTQK